MATATTAAGADRRAGVGGWFGRYGGRYVPETIVPALVELEDLLREGAERAAPVANETLRQVKYAMGFVVP